MKKAKTKVKAKRAKPAKEKRAVLPVQEQVVIRLPTAVAMRLRRASEISQLPQEVVVLSLLSLGLAVAEAQHDDWEVV